MKRFSLLVLSLAFSTRLFAAEGEYSLSSSGADWLNNIIMENLNFRVLADKTKRLELRNKPADNADLALSFETAGEWSNYGYRLKSSPPTLTQNRSRSGSYAAAFHSADPLVLSPTGSSVFNQEAGDFSIDFWVYPTRMADGEQVFLYQGEINNNGRQSFQSVTCAFEKGRLIWRFENVFQSATGEPLVVELQGSLLFKNVWRRHTLRYSSDLGMLELLDDGDVVEVKYANTTGRESAELFLPMWQQATNKKLEIGSFSGYLDDFTILPTYMSAIDFGRYTNKGSLITPAFDLQGSLFKKIRMMGLTPGGSRFRTYVRFAEYRPHLEGDRIPWSIYDEHHDYSRDQNRFIQFKIDFFAGNAASSTPVLQDFVIEREIIPPPPTPGRVSFVRQGKGVLVKWQPLLGADVGGYKLYFGDRPGEYFGTSGSRASPIDVGQATEFYLEGLEIGRLYYFTITAYDTADKPRESAFAPEQSYLP